MVTIILLAVNLFVILCFFISQNCDSNLKKSIVLGVELPDSFKSEEKVLSLTKQFKIINCVVFLIFAFLSVMGFFIKNPTLKTILLISIVVLAAAAYMLIYGIFNKKLKALKKSAGLDTKGDDCWIWGMFYNNPNDNNLTVKSRYGVNTAFNLGNKTGQFVFWAVLIAVIAVAVFVIALLVR